MSTTPTPTTAGDGFSLTTSKPSRPEQEASPLIPRVPAGTAPPLRVSALMVVPPVPCSRVLAVPRVASVTASTWSLLSNRHKPCQFALVPARSELPSWPPQEFTYMRYRLRAVREQCRSRSAERLPPLDPQSQIRALKASTSTSMPTLENFRFHRRVVYQLEELRRAYQ